MAETKPTRRPQPTMFAPWSVDPFWHMWRRLSGGEAGWLRAEEYRQGGDLVLRVEAPGIDPEKDVSISLEGDLLTVAVERHEESEDKEGLRSEFHYGSLSRSIRVPAGTKAEAISAAYADGILTVRLPMPAPEESASKKIPVKRE